MKRPKSAVPIRVSYAGLLGAISSWILIVLYRPTPILATTLFLLACAIPMWSLELQRTPRPKAADKIRGNWRRHLRIIGIATLVMLFITTLTIFRIFSPSAIAGLEEQLLFLLTIASAWMGYMLIRRPNDKNPDSLESLGIAVKHAFKFKKLISTKDRQTFLAWLVKAFYLPLMFSSVYIFLQSALDEISSGQKWWGIFSAIYLSMFAVDTAFATVGYCSTSRRIGAHIRSTESTLLGWSSALVCYPPLNLIVLHQWLSYRDGYEWKDWLANHPVLLGIWGSAILLSTGLYVWSTVAFGPRFSNLTNRGIITSGPYQFLKHPSYVGKNIAWWMISIPFISTSGPIFLVSNCAALIAINLIYMVRAKTEERHLSKDPEYRQYSEWISENGIFTKILAAVKNKTKQSE